MIKLGENLKKFRLKRELTQEQLADILGVSAQAVSRWENQTTYPDITLLPAIASYFEITLDELMSMDDFRSEKQLEELSEKLDENGNKGLIYENIQLLRDTLKIHPANYNLQLKLMNQLSFCQRKNGQALSEKELDSHYLEAVEIGNRILSRCTDCEIINNTISELCYLYSRLGEKEKAIEYAMKLPSLWNSNTVILGELYEGEQKKIHLQQSIRTYMNAIWCTTRDMADLEYKDNSMSTDERIAILKKTLAIFEIVYEDGDYLYDNWFLSTFHRYIAAMAMLEGDHEMALSSLERAAEFAIKSDTLPEKAQHTSLLINKLEYNALEVSKNYEFSNCKELHDKMQWERYNAIRENSRFIAVLNKIKEYC